MGSSGARPRATFDCSLQATRRRGVQPERSQLLEMLANLLELIVVAIGEVDAFVEFQA
jgi:hypothetical protein